VLTLLFVFGALVIVEGVHDEVAPGAPSSAPSANLAESLTRKLEAIEKRAKSRNPGAGESVLVTEGELNSYINLSLGPRLPPGVSGLEVRLEQERIAARAVVDLERVQGRIPSQGAFSPLSLLSGRVPVELKGRLQNQDGFGSLHFEEIRVATIPVPVSMLAQIVSQATRSADNPEGFDVQAPFRLPYTVKRVRVQPGKAWLDF
jgi:hypothetical protein